MRETVKFDPSFPDRQLTGESSASPQTCSGASQSEYLDVQSLSSASSYMDLPKMRHAQHIPMSSSARRNGCSHNHRCEEMQNMSNKRNERLNKPCKDGFCYCFTSDSDDVRNAPATSAPHLRCKALRKEYKYDLPTESECSEMASSDQFYDAKQRDQKKKKRVSLPPEILEPIAGCSHKDGKCSNDKCRRRTFQATNRIKEFHCSDSDAPLIHIVQEVQRNVVVSEIRINRSKLKKSKVRSKSASRAGEDSGNAGANINGKIVNIQNLVEEGEKILATDKTSSVDPEPLAHSHGSKSHHGKRHRNAVVSFLSPSEDDDGAQSDLSSARPRSSKSKGGRLLMKRIGSEGTYKPSTGPPRKPPRNISSSSDCSSLASERIKTSKSVKKKNRSRDSSVMSAGDQPTMLADFQLPQDADRIENTKETFQKLPNNALNTGGNKKPEVTKETFESMSAKADSNGSKLSSSASDAGYSRPLVDSLNIVNDTFETGPSSRQEYAPTCPSFSEVASPNTTTNINDLLRLLPHVPTGPVVISPPNNKLNNDHQPHPNNVEYADVNFISPGEVPNPEQVGWVPPAVYNMLDTEMANQKFVSQNPLAEPQHVGWQPPPKLQIDTVDGSEDKLQNENLHNLTENMELKSTPVKPDIPKNDITPKNLLREKVKNMAQPPAKPMRQNATPKMATVIEMSHSGDDTTSSPNDVSIASDKPETQATEIPPTSRETASTSNTTSVSGESAAASENVSAAPVPKETSKSGEKSLQKRALKHTKSFLESLGFSKKKDGKNRKGSNTEAQKTPPKMVESVSTQTSDTLVLQSKRLNFDYASDDTMERRSITPIHGDTAPADPKPTHHSDDGFDFSRKVQSPKPERSSQRKQFAPRNFLKTAQTDKGGQDESYKSYASDLSEDFTVAVQDLLGKARARLESETTVAETVTNTLTDESVAAYTINARADIHSEPVYAEILEEETGSRTETVSGGSVVAPQNKSQDKAVYAKVVKKGKIQQPLSPHRPAPHPPRRGSEKEANSLSDPYSDVDKYQTATSSEQVFRSVETDENEQQFKSLQDSTQAGNVQLSKPDPIPRNSEVTQVRPSTSRPKHSPPPIPTSNVVQGHALRLPTPPNSSPSPSSSGSSQGAFSPHLDEFFSQGPHQETTSTRSFGIGQPSAPGRDSDSSADGNSKQAPSGGYYHATSPDPDWYRNADHPNIVGRRNDQYPEDHFEKPKFEGNATNSFLQEERQLANRERANTHSQSQERYQGVTSQAQQVTLPNPQIGLHVDPSNQSHSRITPRSSPQGQSSSDHDNFPELYGSAIPGEYSMQSFYSVQSEHLAGPLGWHQSQPIPSQPARNIRNAQIQIPQASTYSRSSEIAENQGATGVTAAQTPQPSTYSRSSEIAENRGLTVVATAQMPQPSTYSRSSEITENRGATGPAVQSRNQVPHHSASVAGDLRKPRTAVQYGIQNEGREDHITGWHQSQHPVPVSSQSAHREQIQDIHEHSPTYPNVHFAEQITSTAIVPNISVDHEIHQLEKYSPSNVVQSVGHEHIAVPSAPQRRRRSVGEAPPSTRSNEMPSNIAQQAQNIRPEPLIDATNQHRNQNQYQNQRAMVSVPETGTTAQSGQSYFQTADVRDHHIRQQTTGAHDHRQKQHQTQPTMVDMPGDVENIKSRQSRSQSADADHHTRQQLVGAHDYYKNQQHTPSTSVSKPGSSATVPQPSDVDYLSLLPSPPHNISMGNPPTIEYSLPTKRPQLPQHIVPMPSTSATSPSDTTTQEHSRRSIDVDGPLTSSTPQPSVVLEPVPSTSYNNSQEIDSPPRARALSKSDLSQTSDIFLENLRHKDINIPRRSDHSDDSTSNLDSPAAIAHFYYYDSSGNGDSTNSSFCREPYVRDRQTSDEYEDPCCREENCRHLNSDGHDTVDNDNESPESGSYKSCQSVDDKDENMNNSTSKDLNIKTDPKSTTRYENLKSKLRASFRKSKSLFKKKRISSVLDRSTMSDNDTRSRRAEVETDDRMGESDFEVDYISALTLLSESFTDTSVKRQLEQTVSLCRQFPEFETSPEMVEAERLLLYSSLKEKSTCLSNDSISSYRSAPKDFIGGRMCVKSFEIPIKPDIRHDEYFNYFYIGVFSNGPDIRSTQSAENVDNAVFFQNCNMLFDDLTSDYEIRVDLYVLRLRKLSSPPIQQDNVPVKIRKSCLSESQEEVVSRFRMHGNFIIRPADLAPFEVESDLENIPQNGEFYLVSTNVFTLPITLFPHNINLSNEVWLTASASYRFKNFELCGFLNVGIANGKLDWNKRWCQIDGLTLYFWNYPQDCMDVEPILKIDLVKCTSTSIRSANREICAKPRSFQLDIRKSTNENEDNGAIQIFLFSAESQNEYNYWVRGLNDVVEFMRAWKLKVQ